MKNSIIIFLLFILNSQAQTIEQLKLETKKFYDAHYNMSLDDITSLYHQNYFEKNTNETITSSLDEWFQNDVLGHRIVFPTMTFIYSSIFEIDNTKYCVITFKNSFRINLENKITNDQVKRELAAYKEIPTYKSVKYEANRNSYLIEENVTWIAVTSASTGNKWKFVEKKPKFNYFDELLAPEIQKKLGM